MQKDYYKTLGVSKSATQAEIKRAFRKLAQKHHPDTGNGDEAKFKELNEAYSVLGDETKRKQYDKHGFVPGSGAGPGGAGRGQGSYNWQDFSNANINFEDLGGFGDIFETFFGGGRTGTRTKSQRGADLETRITIDLKEVITGAERELGLNKWAKCSHCRGEGAEPGASIKTCPICHGSGKVTRATQTMFGSFAQTVVCSDCRGQGKVPEKKCTKCNGHGRTKKLRNLKIKVPAGVQDGSVIRVTGEGEAAEFGGKSGDLYLHIVVKKDPRFIRDGNNLLTEISIPFYEAILGAVSKVSTVEGSVDLKIPAGTQPGQIIKISGRGTPVLNSLRRGDLLIKVNVEIPKKISSAQKKLLEEWDGKRGWF
ncbi:MAG: Chaperone protein DnaJ [candidate division CPR2 bacterium GW2011_GWC1_41_48]|uniref:Chaperone protein DnaJ n=1 Tax=candidate division CPR2 bacterium GW2011_GWC1_41_48 TaxID=1618344 RepID=A0A0G0W993_UNCC2|nr:MAG: Chaperone protein DnaJ [candidate division CPR2 bacterium GW2011_GWC2_39_35]KKS08607.1 MAG: Chaperone protein DnaJ [candidate division CPR2 bacterium GW2011_GWC1_41_48]